MSFMFNKCSSLTSLNISNFNINNTCYCFDNIFNNINKKCRLECDDIKLNKAFIDSINHK